MSRLSTYITVWHLFVVRMIVSLMVKIAAKKSRASGVRRAGIFDKVLLAARAECLEHLGPL